ncbi:MAG: hypothetical protein JWN17_3029 [Frankiales bacterium]|nr:hypothetical protein [Frankiales bacterium]
MRRAVLALSVTTGLLTAGVAYAVPPVVPSTPVTTPFKSANVTHVGTIPLDGVAVSMEVRKVGKQVRAFVSGAGGLSIYDATDPKAPELLGHLPVYDWENEDIAVSKDGRTAVLTEFEGTVYLHVVDVSDPRLPHITGSIVPGGAHTVTCADDACHYLYGSEGQTYDISDRAHPKELPAAQSWGVLAGTPGKPLSGHNVHQDAQGYFISDTSPLVVFRQVDHDPLRLRRVTTGAISKDTNYQHNNIRTRAEQYRPRPAGASLGGPLRDGELLLGEGESNFTGTCDAGSGAFSTWSMAGFDRGVPMKQLDVLRPVSGTYANGDPAVNGLGCSGHWFTERDAKDGSVLVAAAWYEHGTRFLKVDPRTGTIRQVGFFQPVRGATSEAFLMPSKTGDVVWSIDYHSGIDILTFDESKDLEPTVAQTDASWMAKLKVVDTWASLMRQVCRAGAGSTADHAALHRAVVRTGTASFPQLAALGR